MYQGRDDLNQLIKSLTNGEKRYLTNVFKHSAEDTMYRDLYTSLKNGESGVQSKNNVLAGRSKIEQKRMLYKIILRHLRQMHRESSIEIQIQNFLTDVETLYNHSLAEQGLHLLSKAKKLATNHEQFGLGLQILQWEQRLQLVMPVPSRQIEDIRKEEEEMLVKNIQINRLVSLYAQVVILKKTYGYAKGDIRKELDTLIMGNLKLDTDKEYKSVKAKFFRNLILSIYYWMIFDHAKSFAFSSTLLDNSGRIILPEDYLVGLFQHITSSVCLARFSDALNGILLAGAHMEAFNLGQNIPRQQNFFAYDASYRSIIYNYMGKQEELSELISNTQLRLKYWGDSLSKELRHVVMGNLMNAYVGVGNMEKAEAIWNQLFIHESKKVREDIYGDLFIFRIFFLLHCKRYELIQPVAKSAIRYYESNTERKARFQFEDDLAKLFAKSVHWEKKENLARLLESIQSLILDLIFKKTGSIHFQEHYSRYEIWTEAILQDIPYYKSAQNWIAKRAKS